MDCGAFALIRGEGGASQWAQRGGLQKHGRVREGSKFRGGRIVFWRMEWAGVRRGARGKSRREDHWGVVGWQFLNPKRWWKEEKKKERLDDVEDLGILDGTLFSLGLCLFQGTG